MKQERLLNIIHAPHVSEKATLKTEKNNEYVFRVFSHATKAEIKDAVEYLFNAKVKAVRVVNVRAKQRLFRGIEGKKKGWKKAYVTLQPNEKIDLMSA